MPHAVIESFYKARTGILLVGGLTHSSTKVSPYQVLSSRPLIMPLLELLFFLPVGFRSHLVSDQGICAVLLHAVSTA